MNYSHIRSSRPTVFIDKNIRAANPVQPGAAGKINIVYKSTASARGIAASIEQPHKARSRLGSSAGVEVDIFDFAEHDRQSRIAARNGKKVRL